MSHDFGRSGRIPRGNDAVGIVGFSTHTDVVVDGNVTAKRRGPIGEPYVLEGRRGDDGANVNRAGQHRIQRRPRVPRVPAADGTVDRVHPTDRRSRREGRDHVQRYRADKIDRRGRAIPVRAVSQEDGRACAQRDIRGIPRRKDARVGGDERFWYGHRHPRRPVDHTHHRAGQHAGVRAGERTVRARRTAQSSGDHQTEPAPRREDEGIHGRDGVSEGQVGRVFGRRHKPDTMPRERGEVRLVPGTRNTDAASARIRPHSSHGGSIGTDGIRHATGDATVERMPVEHAEHAAAIVGKRVSTVGETGTRKDAAGRTTVAAVARSQDLARRFAAAVTSVEERLRGMSQSREGQHAHDQPLPVGRQRQGGTRTQARTTDGQVSAVTRLFQMRRAPVDMRQMEQRRASEGLRRGGKGGGLSILRSFVGSDIRGQARIPGHMEAVVRDGKEGRTMEGEHGRIFGIVIRG